jgi:hypothetical protein
MPLRLWWDSTDDGSVGDFVNEKSRSMATEDQQSEESSRGWLPPSKIVSPLGLGGYSEEVSGPLPPFPW